MEAHFFYLGLISSDVLTFIRYKQTIKLRDKQSIYIDIYRINIHININTFSENQNTAVLSLFDVFEKHIFFIFSSNLLTSGLLCIILF